jgi:hypothetical protein
VCVSCFVSSASKMRPSPAVPTPQAFKYTHAQWLTRTHTHAHGSAEPARAYRDPIRPAQRSGSATRRQATAGCEGRATSWPKRNSQGKASSATDARRCPRPHVIHTNTRTRTYTRTHSRTHARTHSLTRARTRTRMHARTHTPRVPAGLRSASRRRARRAARRRGTTGSAQPGTGTCT